VSAKLVKNMTDSDLLDMHYFLIEEDDLDDDEFIKGFYIDPFNHHLFVVPVSERAFLFMSSTLVELSNYIRNWS
jgi:hypothetical protein